MKILKRVMAMGMTAVMALSAMSLSAFADEDDVVYSYTDENGNEAVITQAELDAEHWNKDALGGMVPSTYEDFPISLSSYVDEYSNMCLTISYKKNLSDNDFANVTIKDIDSNSVVYQNNLNTGTVHTGNLAMDKNYMITVSETFDNETAEYKRIISTANTSAEMPEYITDGEYDEETPNICIADTADLALSEIETEDGGVRIDPSVTRYVSVSAEELSAYIDNLENDKIYRLFTVDNGKKYYGFISTYTWGKDLGIYIPDYTLNTLESFNAPAVYASAPLATVVKNNAVEMTKFGNYCFSATSSKPYAVYSYEVPYEFQYDSDGDCYNLTIQASAGMYMDVWCKKAGLSTLKKVTTYTFNKGTANLQTILMDENNNPLVTEGDVIYYSIYPISGTSLKGTVFWEYSYYGDDVTGSAYKQYKAGNSLITEPKTEYSYKLRDSYDVDCFYINNSYKVGYYEFRFVNKSKENGLANRHDMNVITYYYNPSLSGFRLIAIDEYVMSGTKSHTYFEIDPKNVNYKYFMAVTSSLTKEEILPENYSFTVEYLLES